MTTAAPPRPVSKCPVCRLYAPPTRDPDWHLSTNSHQANVREPERRADRRADRRARERAMNVEQTAIAIASEYARANGYDVDDRTAIGLVLAGMAIGAAADMPARKELIAGYLRQPANVASAVFGWARSLNTAARGSER